MMTLRRLIRILLLLAGTAGLWTTTGCTDGADLTGFAGDFARQILAAWLL